jgi:hypothetical protein
MSVADRSPALNVAEAGVASDRARAETTLELDPDAAFAFVSEIERLFRLNPHLEIESWQATSAGFHLLALNETNECRTDTAARIDIVPQVRRLVVAYESGLKRTTSIHVEPNPDGTGSRLVVEENYPAIEDPEDPRVAEVDRSLIPWVGAIRRHLLHRTKWGRLPGWHWWNERFMPRLPPKQRRIVRLLVWASVIEFVVFLALVAVLVAAK